MPTNWSKSANVNGISSEVIGAGTESGLSYLDVKVSGTPTSSASFFLFFESSTQIVAANTQTWCGSAYIKLAGGSVTNATTSLTRRGLDASGVQVSGQDETATFVASSSGLHTQRVVTPVSAFSSASVERVNIFLRIAYTNGNPIDLTLRIAGPQLEQGAFATSYIPTTSAAVTRQADSAIVNPISSFYNASEGTLFAEAREGGSDLQYGAVSLDTDTSDNRIDLRRNNDAGVLAMLVTTAGALQMLQSPVLAVAAQTYKLSGAYKVNDCAVCVNGGAVATDASVTLPTLTHFRIGALTAVSPATGPSFFLNGHIRRIAYWPRRLSNTLLQQLTT
jgi:hypothetical protein